MPNPTANYSWSLPRQGDEPWYLRFVDAFQQIDTSVNSVDLDLRAAVTSVQYGLTPRTWGAAILNWRISSVEMAAGPNGWVSSGVSSVTLVTSGVNMVVDLRLTAGFVPAVAGAAFADAGEWQWRVVVNKLGGGPSSMTIPVGSPWAFRFGMVGVVEATPSFLDVVSLGPGTFTFEPQARGRFTASSVFQTASMSHHRYFLTEVRRP